MFINLSKLNFYSLIFLFAGFVITNLLFLLLRKRTRSYALFFFSLAVLLLWANILLTFFILNTGSDAVFHILNQWNSLAAIFIAPFFLLFLIAYAQRGKLLQNLQYVCFLFAPAVVMLFLSWNTSLLGNYSRTYAIRTVWGLWIRQTNLSTIISPLYQIIYAIVGILIILQLYNTAQTRIQKRNGAILLFGYYIPLFAGLFVNTILAGILHMQLVPLGTLLLTLGVIACLPVILTKNVSSFTNEMLATSVYTGMTQALLVLDQAYTIIYCNRAAEKLLQPSSLLLNQPFSKLFPTPQGYDAVIKQLLLSTSTKETGAVAETTILKNATEQIPVAIGATKLFNEDRQIAGYSLLLTDLTQTKAFQQMLEQKNKEMQQENFNIGVLQEQIQKQKDITQEQIYEQTRVSTFEYERLLSSVNNLSIGFILTNTSKTILLVNKAIKDIFYLVYPESNIVLQDVQNHLHGIDLARQIDLAIQGRKNIRLRSVRTENKYLTISISPVTMAGLTEAEIIGAAILIDDGSDVGTDQQNKEEFFTIASHELRTPLSAIRGYLALIKQLYFKKLQDQQLKQMLTDIDISSARLLAIINDFLDTSKLEQGKMDVKKEPCDLVPIVKDAIHETESIALQRGLYLKLETSLTTFMVCADRDRLKQIIINLISNAMKFTTDGGITIRFNEDLPEFIKVLIEDTGKGIPEEGQRLLFHKFQQVSQNSYAHVAGTGLGLYISKLLIEKMGGQIQLEHSEINQGSTFAFTVPRL